MPSRNKNKAHQIRRQEPDNGDRSQVPGEAEESDIEMDTRLPGDARPLEDRGAESHIHGSEKEEEAERLLGADSDTDVSEGEGVKAEAEKRLTAGKSRTTSGQLHPRWKRDRKSRRKKGGGDKEEQERELIYAVEEGARRSSSSSSRLSADGDVDAKRLRELQPLSRKSKVGLCFGIFGVTAGIVVAFIVLLFGAYTLSDDVADAHEAAAKFRLPATLSNGTHAFAPTTILISLDGFRADFLNRNLTPSLRSFIREGISPPYMLPSFPSLTFPNHFTLVTGMYPEAHGIVGNTFWDPELGREFYYTDPARSMTPEWWNAQPLWETAELQGLRSAIHMWPGSEAHIGSREPTYVSKFNDKEPLDQKVMQILDWLDLPGPNDTDASLERPRPQLIASYVPNVDADGHLHGPNSTYIRSTIAEVDGMLGDLFRGLDDRNLTDVVNVVIVSDHGMATTSADRLIQLEDLVDETLIAHIDGWPLYGLRPVDTSPEHLQELYDSLVAKSRLPQYKGRFDVYLRDVNMPKRYFFSANQRIAPLWLVPAAGWAIVTRAEYDLSAENKDDNGELRAYRPRGLHGYDHEHPLMRAIFAARGPAFRPLPRRVPASSATPSAGNGTGDAGGHRTSVFQNIEVYNIVCDSLGLTPVPNNGTLRLPLLSAGRHNSDSLSETLWDPATGVEEAAGNGKGDDESTQLFPPGVAPILGFGGDSAAIEKRLLGKPSFVSWLEGKASRLGEWGSRLVKRFTTAAMALSQ